ncbi:MAG: hypothetical protein FWB85_03605 [Chitinispirillia bacterium]|nr:hypothetical protein [Chitinispirillia bacterium]MCL2241758.1 hypothetical protein [Chitinispirillia bacterium]
MRLKSVICAAAAVVVCFTASANAELHPQTIGLRFSGEAKLWGAELSYQKALGETNRLELGLLYGERDYKGCNGTIYGIAVAYQWHVPFENPAGFAWYVGPAASAFTFICNWGNHNPRQNAGVGAQIGVDYDLQTTNSIPMVISLDARPIISFLDMKDGGTDFLWGISAGVRYLF